MLARSARVTTADDYRAAVRRGARFVAPNTVTYIRRRDGEAARFGFIVSKAVGVAVTRNRVRRRLKAACFELQAQVLPGTEVVIRALPGASTASFSTLASDVKKSFAKASVLS